MLRRRVLAIGLAGLSAVLAGGAIGGCDSGDPESEGSDSTTYGGKALASPTYDPVNYSPPKIDIEQLLQLYAYDSKEPLTTASTGSRVENGIRIDNLTFTGAPETTVPVYLLSRPGNWGKLPGIVFVPDAGSTRDALLTEAADLVRLGAVCAVTGMTFKGTGDPQADSTTVIKAVTAQRRALDLLAKRSDVNASKLAVIGFGWGGAQAQILAGLDTRLSAVVSAGTGGRWSRVAYRSSVSADPATYLDALTRFDGVRYTAITAKRSMLYQFGRHDSGLANSEPEELVNGTVGTKERRDYDAAHDLTAFGAAVTDRKEFLHRELRFRLSPTSTSGAGGGVSASASARS